MDAETMDKKHQIAVITGATSGIGQATKQLLLERGCIVYNLDVAATDDDPAYFIRCDVRSSEEVNKAIAEIKHRENRINMLFANAGKHHVATLENTDDAILEEVIDINIKGVFFTLRAVIASSVRFRSSRSVFEPYHLMTFPAGSRNGLPRKRNQRNSPS
jgi:NAD(P)-dependent dehydrogenase (short-subunit alcohol dehydrogenase family)